MNSKEFQNIVFDISEKLYLKVGSIYEAGITPNFHAAEIICEPPIFVLCNENREWAFSSSFEKHNCKLDYIDFESFSSHLEREYEAKVYRVKELNGPFTGKDYLLDVDVKYWNPKTLGEGIFNWWD